MKLHTLALCALLATPALAEVEAREAAPGRFEVEFRCRPVIAAKSVAVAGSFNGWSATATSLSDPDGDGTWTATLTLGAGRHPYKFVLNGTTWQHDADNPREEPDGHEGTNSILVLGEPTRTGTRGDGEIDRGEARHDPADLAQAVSLDGGQRVVLRVLALANDLSAVEAEVRLGDATLELPAARVGAVRGRDVYEVRVFRPDPSVALSYRFVLADGEARASVPAEGTFALDPRAGRFRTPEWVRDAVFYQIFPDRFRDGDPQTQPQRPPRPEGKPWALDDAFLEPWGAEPTHFGFTGGDLAGITQRLDYLRELGVTALYLNPIFAAESNHRYDARDFEQVDPGLGTLADFHALRDAARERGMRVILDAVFNHSGDEHYAFQDVVAKGEASRYWSWFFVKGFPITKDPPNYACWWDFADLPQLNTKHPEVVEHLLGVGVRWLREGANGWRLDVPNEVHAVNPEFWPAFRERIKAQDPDAYVVGEIWSDAGLWLKGDMFDATMNYPVRQAALDFLVRPAGELDAKGFREALGAQLAAYPEPALRAQFNLLGSHDTPRLLTLAEGDARRVRLAQTFVFAWPGAPVVYYGDEVGLSGGKDPQCRRCFPWDGPQDAKTLAHVKTLARLRAELPVLRRGTVRFLHAGGDVSVFARSPDAGDPAWPPVLCVLNAGAEATQIELPLKGTPGLPTVVLGEARAKRDGHTLRVEVGPLDGAWIQLGEAR